MFVVVCTCNDNNNNNNININYNILVSYRAHFALIYKAVCREKTKYWHFKMIVKTLIVSGRIKYCSITVHRVTKVKHGLTLCTVSGSKKHCFYMFSDLLCWDRSCTLSACVVQYLHMHTSSHTYIHTCTHTCTYTHQHTHTHMNIHTHTCAHAHTESIFVWRWQNYLFLYIDRICQVSMTLLFFFMFIDQLNDFLQYTKCNIWL